MIIIINRLFLKNSCEERRCCLATMMNFERSAIRLVILYNIIFVVYCLFISTNLKAKLDEKYKLPVVTSRLFVFVFYFPFIFLFFVISVTMTMKLLHYWARLLEKYEIEIELSSFKIITISIEDCEKMCQKLNRCCYTRVRGKNTFDSFFTFFYFSKRAKSTIVFHDNVIELFPIIPGFKTNYNISFFFQFLIIKKI